MGRPCYYLALPAKISRKSNTGINAPEKLHPMQYEWESLHIITQQPPPSFLSWERSAARVAASKTSSTPSPVSELHSRYFRAPMTSFMSLPALVVVNFRLFFRISSCASGSSRRSFLRPTNMMGTPGQRSRASSAHLCLTFSRESGESTEKPIRITWALLYARGRSRS